MANNILTGQLCCGFVKTELVLAARGSVVPPCVDTVIEVLTDNERGMFPTDVNSGWIVPAAGTADGTYLNPIMLVVPPQPDFIPLNASWFTFPNGASTPLGMIDLTKTYTFSFEIIRTQPEDSAQFPFTTSIVIQTQNKYYEIVYAGNAFPANGIKTFTINPGDWVAGNAPA